MVILIRSFDFFFSAFPVTLFDSRAIVLTPPRGQLALAFSHIKMLRHFNCTIPVELWTSQHKEGSVSVALIVVFRSVNATFFDFDDYLPPTSALLREGLEHELKAFFWKHLALLFSTCRECLFLDADNMPARDPTYMFDHPRFATTGMVLWPDYWQFPSGRSTLREIFGLSQAADDSLPDIATVESGQILLDKARHWRSLMLATYMQVQHLFFEPLVCVLVVGFWSFMF